YAIVEKGAPEDVRRAVQRSATFTDGAAGTVEMDDGENWNFMGQLLEQGHQARKIKWNYQMGLNYDRGTDPELPGHVTHRMMGELPQRNFCRRWLEFMTHDQWPTPQPY